jgi:hypothetical protein
MIVYTTQPFATFSSLVTQSTMIHRVWHMDQAIEALRAFVSDCGSESRRCRRSKERLIRVTRFCHKCQQQREGSEVSSSSLVSCRCFATREQSNNQLPDCVCDCERVSVSGDERDICRMLKEPNSRSGRSLTWHFIWCVFWRETKILWWTGFGVSGSPE